MTRPHRSLLPLLALGLLAACIDGVSPRITERFAASLTGAKEQPVPVSSSALGAIIAEVHDTATVAGKRDSLAFIWHQLAAQNINNVTAAHIHAGGSEDVGPIMLTLFDGPNTGVGFTGVLSEGEIRRSSPFHAPFTLDSLLRRMRASTAYVNIHTVAFPEGEVRGQIELLR